MATTREKILALVETAKALRPEELSTEGRQLAELYQIACGFGLDPLAHLLPQSDAEADILIDKLLALGFILRGDDLPPFDLERYGEASTTDRDLEDDDDAIP